MLQARRLLRTLAIIQDLADALLTLPDLGGRNFSHAFTQQPILCPSAEESWKRCFSLGSARANSCCPPAIWVGVSRICKHLAAPMLNSLAPCKPKMEDAYFVLPALKIFLFLADGQWAPVNNKAVLAAAGLVSAAVSIHKIWPAK